MATCHNDVSTVAKKNAFCEDSIWLDTAGVTPVLSVYLSGDREGGGNSGTGKRETNMTVTVHQFRLICTLLTKL